MALFKIHWRVYFSHGSNWNQQVGHVPLVWHVAMCSGLAALLYGWAEP